MRTKPDVSPAELTTPMRMSISPFATPSTQPSASCETIQRKWKSRRASICHLIQGSNSLPCGLLCLSTALPLEIIGAAGLGFQLLALDEHAVIRPLR